jgi:hypothetical protein
MLLVKLGLEHLVKSPTARHGTVLFDLNPLMQEIQKLSYRDVPFNCIRMMVDIFDACTARVALLWDTVAHDVLHPYLIWRGRSLSREAPRAT